MSLLKPFCVILEVPVEDLNLKEFELIAFIAQLNYTKDNLRFDELSKLLNERFYDSKIIIKENGITDNLNPKDIVTGAGGSHVWVSRKNWFEEAEKDKKMCERTMVILKEIL